MKDENDVNKLLNIYYEHLYQTTRDKLCRKKINSLDTMKLFFCKNCTDVVRCFSDVRTCKCGESSGFYTDDVNAVFKGKNCVPLGFANSKLVKAVQMSDIENRHQKQPTTCQGVDFTSFVILSCSTSIKIKSD